MDDVTNLISIKRLACLTGTHQQTTRRIVLERGFETIKIGRGLYVYRNDGDKYLDDDFRPLSGDVLKSSKRITLKDLEKKSEWFTPVDVAEMAGVHRATVHSYIRREKMSVLRLEHKIRILGSDVPKLVRKIKEGVAANQPKQAK